MNKLHYNRTSGLEKTARGFYDAAMKATGKKAALRGGRGKQSRSNKHKRQ